LPSARGQGEPLSGRLNPPDGATFAGVLIGEPDDLWLVASDAGYGFTVRLKELHSRNRAGKLVLRVPEGGKVLPASPVPVDPQSLVAVVSSDGKMLVFPVAEVPELPRGKGNKLFGISGKKFAAREEYLTAMTVLPADRKLVVLSGERRMTLSFAELEPYRGARGQRGAMLPRGWRKVDRVESVPA
jgi:topoisomerase-4 subunit A